MTTLLSLQTDYPLQKLNSFGIDAYAQEFLSIDNIAQLHALRANAALASMPKLILGGGSNLVLSDRVPGLVVKISLMGKEVLSEDDEHVYVRAEAGENWHAFVRWTLEQGYGGLENLSLIPGTVGAAPIQNIGAYGLEMQDVFHSLDAFDLSTGEVLTMRKAACRFAYRDSIFKHDYKDKMVILGIVFALPKKWIPKLDYADVARYLADKEIASPTPLDVSNAVIAIRQSKLPDPAVIGNAGSFFKNPIVSATLRDELLHSYPKMVSYPQPGGDYKLAAGWLIEECGWKGKSLGSAGVYEKQALVLVNLGCATGVEVRRLAQQIQRDVQKKFAVRLEVEPVFV
ncbi:UDP-N-acetylmuramate dehydrogenase [Undibacterium terreum]|uniref:UDP-N-acetylenolpyruvoylglucosamine reductase n=1 Tax=Undibacterium terreum TaxID=1224302 RepID=A0A916XII9_9BURK|nr:UDP-N-acetylmuramate dehydrogenase [Undibacterium terreum]GGC73016.1 UDP-N-acetylenolpyruvoylglucosamine reductase [Undibacterium terreum]